VQDCSKTAIKTEIYSARLLFMQLRVGLVCVSVREGGGGVGEGVRHLCLFEASGQAVQAREAAETACATQIRCTFATVPGKG